MKCEVCNMVIEKSYFVNSKEVCHNCMWELRYKNVKKEMKRKYDIK